MKERPIIFLGEMVRAILDNRKTQTRRVINSLLGFASITDFVQSDSTGYDWCFRDRRALWNDITTAQLMAACPYGQPGDRLWVRETFCQAENAFGQKSEDIVYYRETDGDPLPTGHRWHPSIHMPRWASRILLEIIDIRVERVQEISEEDAIAEGIENLTGGAFGYKDYEGDVGATFQPWQSFNTLWDSINAKRGYDWDKNPWVWIIEFRRTNGLGKGDSDDKQAT